MFLQNTPLNTSYFALKHFVSWTSLNSIFSLPRIKRKEKEKHRKTLCVTVQIFVHDSVRFLVSRTRMLIIRKQKIKRKGTKREISRCTEGRAARVMGTGSADKCLNHFSFMLGYAVRVPMYTWPCVIHVLCVFEGILNKAAGISYSRLGPRPFAKDGHAALLRVQNQARSLGSARRNDFIAILDV